MSDKKKKILQEIRELNAKLEKLSVKQVVKVENKLGNPNCGQCNQCDVAGIWREIKSIQAKLDDLYISMEAFHWSIEKVLSKLPDSILTSNYQAINNAVPQQDEFLTSQKEY